MVLVVLFMVVQVIRMVDSVEVDMVAGEAQVVEAAGVVEVRPTTIHFHLQVEAAPSTLAQINSMSLALTRAME